MIGALSNKAHHFFDRCKLAHSLLVLPTRRMQIADSEQLNQRGRQPPGFGLNQVYKSTSL